LKLSFGGIPLTGKEKETITLIEKKDKTFTAVFTIRDFYLTQVLEPVDDNYIKGSLFGKFDAKTFG